MLRGWHGIENINIILFNSENNPVNYFLAYIFIIPVLYQKKLCFEMLSKLPKVQNE